MPQIPIYKTKPVSLPRATIPTGPHPAEIAGRGLSQAGKILAGVKEKMNQVRQVRELSDAKADANVRQVNFILELRDRDDSENFVNDHTKLVDRIASDWHKKIHDPEVLHIFENHHKQASARLHLAVDGFARGVGATVTDADDNAAAA